MEAEGNGAFPGPAQGGPDESLGFFFVLLLPSQVQRTEGITVSL